MDIIGTGFGRTGTLSLKLALEQLGFGPCHHMREAMQHPGEFHHFAAYTRGEPVDWQQAFARYRSQVDFPGAAVWRELVDAFPDAKVVHTVRDPQRWYDSTYSTIYQAPSMVAPWVRRAIPMTDLALGTIETLIWDGLFDGRFEDQSHAIEVFERHTAEVIAAVPPERLLVYEVAQGWEPLCEFLDVAVPSTPFPRVNDTASMQRQHRVVHSITHGAPWVAFAATLALGARRLARRRSGNAS